MQNILENEIPLWLDLDTYRSYYRVVKVPAGVIELLKLKFRVECAGNGGFFRKIVFKLPNGDFHGEYSKWQGKYLVEKGTYVDDKKEGLVQMWRAEDGDNLWCEIEYASGLFHGWSRKWLRGCMRREVHYARGKKSGPERCWYEEGQLSMETMYMDDVKHGIQKLWHQNGKLWQVSTYLAGMQHGYFVMWDENGALVKISKYEEHVEKYSFDA